LLVVVKILLVVVKKMTMEIGALVGDKVYFIEYFAEENYYSKYFPTIQKIINSVELIK
jgi:hypothetical protein